MLRSRPTRSALLTLLIAMSVALAACIDVAYVPPTPTPVPTPTPTDQAVTPQTPDVDDDEATPEETGESVPGDDSETEPASEPDEDADADADADTNTEAEAAPEPEPETDPFAGASWQERGRLTVLLVGTDAGPERDGARADTVMVATLNLETGQSALFGLPRNIGNLPLPDHVARIMGDATYPDMLFELYADAQAYPDLAPNGGDPGMIALQGVTELLLGIPIDYYAMLDMAGFVAFIDAFGGVTVNVPQRIHVRLSPPVEGGDWRVYDIPAGEQHLDGEEAFAFVRTRTGTSDYDRMHRQRCLIASATRQTDTFQLLRNFPAFIDVIRDHLVTDVPLDLLPEFVLLREVIDPDQIYGVGFVPPYYTAGLTARGYSIPDVDRIQQTVQQTLESPQQQPGGAGSSEPFSEHC